MAELKAKYENNLKLAEDFYQDPRLQIEFRIIYLGAQWLVRLYADTWKTLAKGQVLRGS